MPETVEEFYAQYVAELQSQSELNALQPVINDVQTLATELQSTSKVAPHNLWLFDFSVFSWMQKQLFNRHKAEVETIVAANTYGHPQWWVEQLKAFQYGTSLTFVNDRPGYMVNDDDAKIVKRAACINLGGGKVLLKANSVDGNGDPVALISVDPSNQLQSLTEYCRMIQPAGPDINLISLNPDKLRLQADVKVDPLVFNSDGTLISNGTYPVEEAAKKYLANIKYNGLMSLTFLKDEVQRVTGVNDFIITSAIAVQGINTFTITRLFQTVAGSVREDNSPGFTFRDLFTYSFGD